MRLKTGCRLFGMPFISFVLVACTSPPTEPPATAAAPQKIKQDYLSQMNRETFDGPHSLSVPGSDRVARVFLPKNRKDGETFPLLLLLHGYTSYADQVNFYFGLAARVTEKKFILLTPEGTTNSQGDQFWNAGNFCCDFEKTGVDDVKYLLATVEEAAAKYPVDRERIYLYGHSNGGFMSNRLLCETENVFAGAVSVAGAVDADPKGCRVKQPISYLQVHAENDATVAYGKNKDHSGGKAAADRRAAMAGCSLKPVKGGREDFVHLIPKKDTTLYHWPKCRAGTEVGLWVIDKASVANHIPHAPFFTQPGFADATLDFLLRHSRSRP